MRAAVWEMVRTGVVSTREMTNPKITESKTATKPATPMALNEPVRKDSSRWVSRYSEPYTHTDTVPTFSPERPCTSTLTICEAAGASDMSVA